jgi:hypothetical protein
VDVPVEKSPPKGEQVLKTRELVGGLRREFGWLSREFCDMPSLEATKQFVGIA